MGIGGCGRLHTIDVERHGAALKSGYQMAPRSYGVGGLCPGPSGTLFIGAVLDSVGGIGLKIPNEIPVGGCTVHQGYPVSLSGSVHPKGNGEIRRLPKLEGRGAALHVLVGAVKGEGRIGGAVPVRGRGGAVIGEVVDVGGGVVGGSIGESPPRNHPGSGYVGRDLGNSTGDTYKYKGECDE